jgi:hypothetical protein
MKMKLKAQQKKINKEIKEQGCEKNKQELITEFCPIWSYVYGKEQLLHYYTKISDQDYKISVLGIVPFHVQHEQSTISKHFNL